MVLRTIALILALLGTAPVFAALPTTPEAYWPLDKDTQESTGHYTSTLLGTGTFSEQSLLLNGEGFMDSGTRMLDARNTDFTVMAWVKPTTATNGSTMIVQTLNDANGGVGRVVLGRYADTAQNSAKLFTMLGTRLNSNASLLLNTWHHVAVSVDHSDNGKSTVSLFINGKLDNSVTATIEESYGVLRLGAGKGATATAVQNGWQGHLDEVRVYRAALTGNDILQAILLRDRHLRAAWTFEKGSKDDISGSGFHLTAKDNAAVVENTLKLDGSGDYMETVSPGTDPSKLVLNPAQGDFSALAWVKLDTHRGNADDQIILQQRGDTPGRVWLARRGSAHATQPNEIYTALGGKTLTSGQQKTLPLNRWTHVALTVQGSTVTLFVDGQAVATGTRTIEAQTQGAIRLGAHKNNSNYWSGNLDEVRIYTTALSPERIAALKALGTPNGTTPPPPPPAPEPIQPPQGLTATVVSALEVQLKWSAPAGKVAAAKYRVYRNNSLLADSVTTTQYADLAVEPEKTYSYAVSAVDAAGKESARSNTQTVTTPARPDLTPPTVPTGVEAKPLSEKTIELTWKPSTDTQSSTIEYLVYRKGENNDGTTPVATLTGTSYNDSGLSPATLYTYRIAARDAAKNVSAQSSPVTVATLALKDDPVDWPKLVGIAVGQTYFVNTCADLRARIDAARPGDVILVRMGTYYCVPMYIKTSGTKEAPIILTSELTSTGEKAIFHGGDGWATFNNSAHHWIVGGFKFRNFGNYVIKLADSVVKEKGAAQNNRFTDSIFESNGVDRGSNSAVITVGEGAHKTRIDHNIFRKNYNHPRVTYDSDAAYPTKDVRIDHNFFGPVADSGFKGTLDYEAKTLRGPVPYEMGAFQTCCGKFEMDSEPLTLLFEYNTVFHPRMPNKNVMYVTDTGREHIADTEVIEIKTGGAVIRYNTIEGDDYVSAISLRAGHGNRIEGNVLKKVYIGSKGSHHVIANNAIYGEDVLEVGIKMSRWGCRDGTTTCSKQFLDEAAHNLIANNTILHTRNYGLRIGDCDLKACNRVTNTLIANNVVLQKTGKLIHFNSYPEATVFFKNNLACIDDGAGGCAAESSRASLGGGAKLDTQLLTLNPQLTGHTPALTSPVVDSGTQELVVEGKTVVLDRDINDNKRVLGAQIDRGAVEVR